MATVTQQQAHRLAAMQGVYRAQRHRYSNAAALAFGLHRFSTPAHLSALRLHRLTSLPQEVEDGVGEYDLAWRCGVGDLECSFKVLWDGVSKNLGEAPASLEVQLNESASASWTLTIIDPTGDYHPRKAGSEWEEWMDDAAYDESGNIIKKLVAVVDWGGVEWTFVGVPVAFGHTRNKQSQRLEFKWTGLDVSAKLFRRSQTLDTIRADRRSSSAPMLRTVLGQIASAYDVDADWGLVDNQPVRTMHMQDGRPGDWMQQLLEAAPFAEWKVRGETLIGFQPTVKSAPDWVYDRHACVEEESLDANAGDMINKVEVRSAREAGSKPEGMPPVQVNEYGVYRTSFNPPLSGVQWRYVQPNPHGFASNFVYRRGGNVISVRNGVRSQQGFDQDSTFMYAAHLKGAPIYDAEEVEFTWGRPANVPGEEAGGPTSAPGEIEFFGALQDNPDSELGETESVTGAVRVNQAAIDKYGENPIELSPNPLLTTLAQMERYGDRYLCRASRIEPKALKVPLNLLLEVGDTIRLTDSVLGTSELRYVTQVAHTITNDATTRGTRFTSVVYQMSPNGR